MALDSLFAAMNIDKQRPSGSWLTAHDIDCEIAELHRLMAIEETKAAT